MSKNTDKTCFLCEETKSIFSFSTCSGEDVCSVCQMGIVSRAVREKWESLEEHQRVKQQALSKLTPKEREYLGL